MPESFAGGAARQEGFIVGRVMAHPPANLATVYSIQFDAGVSMENGGENARGRGCPSPTRRFCSVAPRRGVIVNCNNVQSTSIFGEIPRVRSSLRRVPCRFRRRLRKGHDAGAGGGQGQGPGTSPGARRLRGGGAASA